MCFKKKPILTIEPFGQLRYRARLKAWQGWASNVVPDRQVELSIAANSKNEDISEQLAALRQFAADADAIVANLVELSYLALKGTKWELPLIEVEKMYFLSAIALQENHRSWWVVLEPEFDVPTIYSQLLRFTVTDGVVTWKNF
jgi:hypothetical protein